MELLDHLHHWEARLKEIEYWTKQNVIVDNYDFVRFWSNLDAYGAPGWRLSLHKLTPQSGWLKMHNHPWPFIVYVLEGSYEMRLAFGDEDDYENVYSLDQPPTAHSSIHFAGPAKYEMLDGRAWHAIRPTLTTYSLMLSAPPSLMTDILAGKGPKIESSPDWQFRFAETSLFVRRMFE